MDNVPYVPRSIVYYNKDSSWDGSNGYGTMPNLNSTREAGATRSNTVTGSEDYKYLDPSSRFIGSTALDDYSLKTDPFADQQNQHFEEVSGENVDEYKPGDKFIADNGVEYIVADDYYAYPVSEIYPGH